MQRIGRNDPCPCGSGQKFKRCCDLYLSGSTPAPTPEALMRSRYSAYVTGNAEYLYRTTHPENEAVRGIDREAFIKETRFYCSRVEFTGLTMHRTEPPDTEGVGRVEFTASYRAGQESGSFRELSEFVQVDGAWVYTTGRTE